jgi:hypothetical protein
MDEPDDDPYMFEMEKLMNRRSKTIVSPKSGNPLNALIDASDYYKQYEDKYSNITGNLVGECFIGFSKLLQSELKKFDKRDSQILQNKMSFSFKSQTSLRGNHNNSLKLEN